MDRIAGPKSLPKNFALGFCPIFVVFRQINVKQKSDRAQPTFDLGFSLFRTILETPYKYQDVP